MSRNAFVPMEWLTAPIGAEALRTLILISSFADNKTGECYPTNRVLLAILKKDERNLQRDVKQLVKAGLISIQDGQGRNRKFRIESPEWFNKPRGKSRQETDRNPGENRHPSPPAKNAGVIETTPAENAGDTPTKNAGDTPTKNAGDTPTKNAGVPIRTLLKNSLNELSEKSGSLSEESEPGEFSEDCRSALADLGRPPEPIPAEIKRMATQVNAESWIGQVQFQEIPLTDWRVKETLRTLHARGGNKGVNYAWRIFRDLPEQQPRAEANGHTIPMARKKPAELIGAEAGLAMARRALDRGETDQAEVDRYEAKVADLKRKAGIE